MNLLSKLQRMFLNQMPGFNWLLQGKTIEAKERLGKAARDIPGGLEQVDGRTWSWGWGVSRG